MSIVYFIVGIIMVTAGLFVYFIGYKRDVPNKYLWALFPIFHGLHEFMEFLLASNAPFIIEQLEELFAFAGAFVLLAAAFEYNEVIPRPIGKFAALIGFIAASYFIFALPEEIFEEIEHFKYDYGIVSTNPMRFFQGVFMTILAILALLLTTIYLIIKSKRGLITIDSKLVQITGAAIVLLAIYAFFEGFESDNPVFMMLRGISLSLFIIVPVIFILTNTVGLQRLLIIQGGGIPLLGFNFPSNTFLDMDSSEGADFILAAGFLSAVSTFSGNILKAGSTFSIRSKQMYFTITQVNGNIYTLQSLSSNKNLEKNFYEFGKNINPQIPETNHPDDVDQKFVRSKIEEYFSIFY